MNPLHDTNPTTFVAYYEDGSVKRGLSYLEAVELFNSREQNGVQSIAPVDQPYTPT